MKSGQSKMARAKSSKVDSPPSRPLPLLLPSRPEKSLPFVEAIAKVKTDPDNAGAWKAYAYTRPDGFFPFLTDVVGLRGLDPKLHAEMARYASGYVAWKNPKFPRRNYTMVLVFRGGYKTTICSICNAAWEIACHTINNGGVCNITIAIACEREKLAKQIVGAIRKILEKREFIELFGDHKPNDRSSKWSSVEIESAFRDSAIVKDPTVFTIALGVERTGYHADLVIADDLQAYASSYTPEQLDNCFELYTLLHSIMNPGGRMVLVGTRWSYSDIYQRVMATNKGSHEPKQFLQLVVPILGGDGKPSFPSRFPQDVIDDIRSKTTSYVWSCQYLLNPTPDEARKFRLKDLQYRDEIIDETFKRRGFQVFTGADPAWISEDRIRSGEAKSNAYSVVVTIAVDPAFSIYILDGFREQCSKDQLSAEIWRQYRQHNSIGVGIQQFDYKVLYEEFDRQTRASGFMPRIEWISSSGQRKEDRIEGTLEGFVRAKKLFLMRAFPWMEEELLNFPYHTFDFLDALCNAVKIANAPMAGRSTDPNEAKKTETDRFIDSLMRSGGRKSWGNAY